MMRSIVRTLMGTLSAMAGVAGMAHAQSLPPCGTIAPAQARAASPPALVQLNDAFRESGTTISSSFTQPTTTGNLIVAYVVWDNTGTVSLSDSSGNTYHAADAGPTVWNNGSYSAQLFYAGNIAGGAAAVTATLSVPASSFALLYVHEYSGLHRDQPLWAGRAAQGVGTLLDSGEITILTSSSLLFGAGASLGAVSDGGAGFTLRSMAFGNLTEDRFVTSPGSYSATASHGGGAWAMQLAAFRLQPVCQDTRPPSIPTGLTATALSDTEVQLTWNASTDNIGVAGYNVYRNTRLIARTTTTSFHDRGLTPETTYSYRVSAFDDAGKVSKQSTAALVRTRPIPPPTLEPADGGPDWYAQFANPFPTDPGFFPIGVWFESVMWPEDVEKDRAIGLNTYVELTANSDLALVRAGGMHAIHSGEPGGTVGSETKAWLLTDEADMWAGPGFAAWTGNLGGPDVCIPAGEPCGYTVMETLAARRPADGRLRYSNYGKGVTFWETDEQAARFVNDYQELTSADNYWFTDGWICNSDMPGVITDFNCAVAANYGWTVQRIRNLIQPARSRPVWAFVEVGHPFTEAWFPYITPPQVRAAVWHSLIAGARGIIYFNHTFDAGPCWSFHVLRDEQPGCYAEIRAAVGELNAQIAALAPVLNASTATTGWSQGAGTRALVKWWDRHFYVLAGSEGHAVTGTFSVPCVGDATATVLHENRTIPVSGGTFTDAFADGNAVHIYRIDGGSSCGLP